MSRKRDDQYLQLARLRMNRKTFAQCAEEMEISIATLKRWVLTEDYKTIWSDLQKHWRETSEATVLEAGLEAISVMKDLMRHGRSDYVKFQAAKAIGDWAGLGTQVESNEQDDRSQLEELYKLAEARKQVNIQINLNQPTPENVNVIEGECRALPAGNEHVLAS